MTKRNDLSREIISLKANIISNRWEAFFMFVCIKTSKLHQQVLQHLNSAVQFFYLFFSSVLQSWIQPAFSVWVIFRFASLSLEEVRYLLHSGVCVWEKRNVKKTGFRKGWSNTRFSGTLNRCSAHGLQSLFTTSSALFPKGIFLSGWQIIEARWTL